MDQCSDRRMGGQHEPYRRGDRFVTTNISSKAWLLFGDEDCKRMADESFKAVNKYVARYNIRRIMVW